MWGRIVGVPFIYKALYSGLFPAQKLAVGLATGFELGLHRAATLAPSGGCAGNYSARASSVLSWFPGRRCGSAPASANTAAESDPASWKTSVPCSSRMPPSCGFAHSSRFRGGGTILNQQVDERSCSLRRQAGRAPCTFPGTVALGELVSPRHFAFYTRPFVLPAVSPNSP